MGSGRAAEGPPLGLVLSLSCASCVRPCAWFVLCAQARITSDEAAAAVVAELTRSAGREVGLRIAACAVECMHAGAHSHAHGLRAAQVRGHKREDGYVPASSCMLRVRVHPGKLAARVRRASR